MSREKKRCINVFYDEEKTINACDDEPSLIFELLKEEHIELIDKILSRKTFDINVVDEQGNNILTRLLKKGYYDVVLNHIKDKRWDVNHQNNDGDTFTHILASMNYVNVVDIIKVLKKNKAFLPNIKNNNGETILDMSMKNSYIYTTAKILEDNRFNNVGVISFKKLYDTYINNKNYGKYTKLNNLDMIIINLDKKEVTPKVKEVINNLKENYDLIKEEFINDKTDSIDNIINSVLFG